MSIHPKSWNGWLYTFDIGERRYVETTAENYASTMRTVVTPKCRRPAEMEDMEFTTALFTAVGQPAGNIRYLICVERVR